MVFTDWRENGKSVYNSEKGIKLSLGPFHSGTTFEGEISLNKLDEQEIRAAIREGYEPIFHILPD